VKYLLLLALLASPAFGQEFSNLKGVPALQLGQVLDAQGGYTTWFNVNSTHVGDGAGSFMEFLVPNAKGTLLPSVTINAGFITASPGKEQGDIEFLTYCNGITSLNGYNCGFVFEGEDQALFAPMAGTQLGLPNLRWETTWTNQLGVVAIQCPNGGECIQIQTCPADGPCTNPQLGFIPIIR
jgi:hypothetical protein